MKKYPEYKSKFMQHSKSGKNISGTQLTEFSGNYTFCSNAELLKTINQLKKPNNKVYQQKLKDSLL